jgi:hypothetical protein
MNRLDKLYWVLVIIAFGSFPLELTILGIGACLTLFPVIHLRHKQTMRELKENEERFQNRIRLRMMWTEDILALVRKSIQESKDDKEMFSK